MRFTIVLLFSLIVTVAVGALIQKIKFHKNPLLVSPVVSKMENSNSIDGWEVFVNNYYGYKIKHPSDVAIKNKANGDVDLQKEKTISLSITQEVLTDGRVVDMVIKEKIDQKKKEMGDEFDVINTVSPIALGLVTAQTYSSNEKGQNVAYYYVPQSDIEYLLISNYSKNDSANDYLVSENIIYSIELLP